MTQGLIAMCLIHDGQAHQTFVQADRSARGMVAISFDTLQPPAGSDQKVRRFQMHLTEQEVRALIETLNCVVDPPF